MKHSTEPIPPSSLFCFPRCGRLVLVKRLLCEVVYLDAARFPIRAIRILMVYIVNYSNVGLAIAKFEVAESRV